MSPLDSGILQKHRNPTKLSTQSWRSRKIVAVPGIWINRITHRWSIHRKIACGYVLSVSAAILGTAVGLTVGEYYENKAVEEFGIVQERHELMSNLEKAALEIKVHQQQALAASGNITNQQFEIKNLIGSLNEAKTYLYKLKYNLKDNRGLPDEFSAKCNTLLQSYNTELEAYNQLVQSLAQKVELDQPAAREVQAEKQILWRQIQEKQATKLENLSQSLEQLVDSTVDQQSQARATFKAAKVLRLLIILTSMVLSLAIAAALALYTSCAIARPIKAVTNVAERATQEGNFDLQAPVTTDDEIGVLATSLNDLIQRVATQIHELKQAQAQLIQSEKMSGLGQMVAGIAHEINNPVNFIYANIKYATDYTQELLDLVELYQHYYPQPVSEIQYRIEEIDLDFISEDLARILSSMHVGSERIRQIILSLRNFSRLDEAEMKQVDIHEGLENTLLILSHRLNQGLEVIKAYGSLPLVKCYPAQLNQVFMNILSNAIDELIVHKDLSTQQIIIETRLIEANQIEVQIRDSGLGIAPEIKDKIFDPFFTTKPVGKGTGMGLAICYQIVEKHQGKIEVISELGKGANFVVTLPL